MHHPVSRLFYRPSRLQLVDSARRLVLLVVDRSACSRSARRLFLLVDHPVSRPFCLHAVLLTVPEQFDLHADCPGPRLVLGWFQVGSRLVPRTGGIGFSIRDIAYTVLHTSSSGNFGPRSCECFTPHTLGRGVGYPAPRLLDHFCLRNGLVVDRLVHKLAVG